jgi:hypothetical protein
MSILAQFQYSNTFTSYPDQNGGEIDSADVYISLVDAATGAPANGNNATVSYFIITNGIGTAYTVNVPGQSILIYSGVISETHYDANGTELSATNITFSLPANAVIPPTSAPPLSGPCNLAISYITVDQPESAPGAHDGQIRVQATSAYLPIQYSNNAGQTFQTSPVFTGLSGGSQQILVKDANSCTAQAAVTVPLLVSLLVADPSVTFTGGNSSRWNAAFNPIVFTYQRRDYEITGVYNDAGPGNVRLKINAALTSSTGGYSVSTNDLVYVNAGPYIGVFKVVSADNNGNMVLPVLYAGNATGFININSLRPYYKIITQITYTDTLTGRQQLITSANRPNNAGLIKADISNFLQSLLTAKDASDFTQACFLDTDLSAAYSVSYAESWDDPSGQPLTSALSIIPATFHVLYAAKQLGDPYGGNLAAYVPFPAVTDPLQLARWITDFAEPAYSNGYPFDIGFLIDESLAGLTLTARLSVLDINRAPLPGGTQTLFLINEDGSFLLNEDGSRFITDDQNAASIPLTNQAGLNRLRINYNFPPEACYFSLAVSYAIGNTIHDITQTQIVRIDDAVDEQSVYLRWIGLSGCWNYYRFVYNQEIALDVQNATIIKKFVTDWASQDSVEEVIAKQAGQKMKVMAEDLSIADIKGLQSIKYSPKVQMLTGTDPVRWQTVVINTATFAEYETLNGQAPFSVTFNMPSVNIQTQ